MTDCKNLRTEDVTPWHSDVFDHPDYKYTCKLSGKEVIPCLRCNHARCKDYEPPLVYKYDIFNESDIHCRECQFVGNPDKFEIYCTKSGHIVQDQGYCNYIKKRDNQK